MHYHCENEDDTWLFPASKVLNLEIATSMVSVSTGVTRIADSASSSSCVGKRIS